MTSARNDFFKQETMAENQYLSIPENNLKKGIYFIKFIWYDNKVK